MQTLSISRPVLRAPRRAAVIATAHEEVIDQSDASGAETRLSIDSMALLRGSKCVQIAHNGSLYKLQATKLGKLILTK